MDIWAWVHKVEEELYEQGHTRLASIIENLPSWVLDNDKRLVDGIMPEALALARDYGHPWLEIYLRHWYLQSKILLRYEIKGHLNDAIDLVDKANRDQTRDCPQSICVTQDLCSGYGLLDGPGFAQERLDVAKETLARINPQWPCYACIGTEYVMALIDAGRARDAYDFYNEAERSLRLAGHPEQVYGMRQAFVDALLELGMSEQALDYNEKAVCEGGGASFDMEKRIDHARILVYLGRYEDAVACLPSWEAVSGNGGYAYYWSDAVYGLLENGGLPLNWQWAGKLAATYRMMTRLGVYRRAIKIAHRHASLALKRNCPGLAAMSADDIEALIPSLHKDLGATDDLERLRAQIAKVETDRPDETTFNSPEEVLDNLPENRETAYEILRHAVRKWHDHEGVAVNLANVLIALEQRERAIDGLGTFLERHPTAQATLLFLGDYLVATRDDQRLNHITAPYLQGEPADNTTQIALWLCAHMAYVRKNWHRAESFLARLLGINGEHVGALNLQAEALRRLGRYPEAMILLNRLVSINKHDEAVAWDRMLVGTLVGDWEAVRESAGVAGLELDSDEGPIEEHWGLCRIRISENQNDLLDHDAFDYFAVRTGPVTANIIEMAGSRSKPNHYADEVIFNPMPLNEPKEGEEQDENFTFIYPLETIRKKGGFKIYTLDGVHPGPNPLKQFEDGLRAKKIRISWHGSEDYRLPDPDSEETLPGLYGYIAIPGEVQLADVHQLLSELTADYPHPLLWQGLVEDLGLQNEIEAQGQAFERYEMW